VLADKKEFRWVSVGDSPLLLYRDGRPKRLNADHSLRSEPKVDKLAKEKQSPNTITSALAGALIPLIDGPSQPIEWQSKDVLVAASDGLLTLEQEALSRVLDETGDEALQKASQVVAKVAGQKRNRQDNTTVAILLSPDTTS
jgi:serine/threonine protein phosphatase PrpC